MRTHPRRGEVCHQKIQERAVLVLHHRLVLFPAARLADHPLQDLALGCTPHEGHPVLERRAARHAVDVAVRSESGADGAGRREWFLEGRGAALVALFEHKGRIQHVAPSHGVGEALDGGVVILGQDRKVVGRLVAQALDVVDVYLHVPRGAPVARTAELSIFHDLGADRREVMLRRRERIAGDGGRVGDGLPSSLRDDLERQRRCGEVRH